MIQLILATAVFVGIMALVIAVNHDPYKAVWGQPYRIAGNGHEWRIEQRTKRGRWRHIHSTPPMRNDKLGFNVPDRFDSLDRARAYLKSLQALEQPWEAA